MSFKDFSVFSSGSLFVWRSGAILSMLMRNICLTFVFNFGQQFRSTFM